MQDRVIKVILDLKQRSFVRALLCVESESNSESEKA